MHQSAPFSSVIRLTWCRLLRWSADVCIELCNSLNLDFCKVPPQLCYGSALIHDICSSSSSRTHHFEARIQIKNGRHSSYPDHFLIGKRDIPSSWVTALVPATTPPSHIWHLTSLSIVAAATSVDMTWCHTAVVCHTSWMWKFSAV